MLLIGVFLISILKKISDMIILNNQNYLSTLNLFLIFGKKDIEKDMKIINMDKN